MPLTPQQKAAETRRKRAQIKWRAEFERQQRAIRRAERQAERKLQRQMQARERLRRRIASTTARRGGGQTVTFFVGTLSLRAVGGGVVTDLINTLATPEHDEGDRLKQERPHVKTSFSQVISANLNYLAAVVILAFTVAIVSAIDSDAGWAYVGLLLLLQLLSDWNDIINTLDKVF